MPSPIAYWRGADAALGLSLTVLVGLGITKRAVAQGQV
jgi:hypothetical protein